MGQITHLEPPPAPLPVKNRPSARSRRPPPHATITRDVHCAACWYNLRGLAFLGRCPECGTRYDAWRNIKNDDAKAKGKQRRKRYMRTITHEPILAPIDALRAAGFLIIMLTLTGATVLGALVMRRVFHF